MKDILAASFFRAAGSLPLSINHLLGKAAGWSLWASHSELRRFTEININLCYPELSLEENKKLVRQSLIETGVTLFELGAAWTKDPLQLIQCITEVEGEELLLDAIKDNKGVMLLAPHLGNWEIAGYFLTHFYSMTTMYKPSKLEALDKMIYKARTQLGLKVVPATNHGVIAIFKCLKQHGITGILPDQEPDTSGGVFAPLFGIEALTPVIASKMLQRTDTIALGFYCLRLPKGKYRLVFKKADPMIYSKDLLESVTGLNRSIEKFIADAPEQYQWEYRRFSKRPNKEPKLYKKNTPA